MLGEIDPLGGNYSSGRPIGTLAALASALRGEVVVQQYRIVVTELVVRRIRHMLFPIRDDQGRVSRIGGVAADITKPADIQVYVLNPDDLPAVACLFCCRRVAMA